MMLGQVVSRLGEASDESVLALVGDLVLFTRIQAAASAQGQPPAAYVREAIARFLQAGSEEGWIAAIGQMQGDPAPGDRLIARAIEEQLRRDGT